MNAITLKQIADRINGDAETRRVYGPEVDFQPSYWDGQSRLHVRETEYGYEAVNHATGERFPVEIGEVQFKNWTCGGWGGNPINYATAVRLYA